MRVAPAVAPVRLKLPRVVAVFVSAGSNMDPVRHLSLACRELADRFGPLQLSAVYRNKALGFEGDDFLNLAIGFETAELPAAIVAELERLHRLAGRVRGANPFSPRTLDLDLLLYGSDVNPDPLIRVPREDVRKYSFVLGPLAELAPDLLHPLTGETMAQLWRQFDKSRHPLQRTDIRLC